MLKINIINNYLFKISYRELLPTLSYQDNIINLLPYEKAKRTNKRKYNTRGSSLNQTKPISLS